MGRGAGGGGCKKEGRVGLVGLGWGPFVLCGCACDDLLLSFSFVTSIPSLTFSFPYSFCLPSLQPNSYQSKSFLTGLSSDLGVYCFFLGTVEDLCKRQVLPVTYLLSGRPSSFYRGEGVSLRERGSLSKGEDGGTEDGNCS